MRAERKAGDRKRREAILTCRMVRQCNEPETRNLNLIPNPEKNDP